MQPRHQDQVSAANSQQQIVLSADRARQGVTGHNVRYVLVFGLAGAVVTLTLLYLLYVIAD